jgi:hypothetical protein
LSANFDFTSAFKLSFLSVNARFWIEVYMSVDGSRYQKPPQPLPDPEPEPEEDLEAILQALANSEGMPDLWGLSLPLPIMPEEEEL